MKWHVPCCGILLAAALTLAACGGSDAPAGPVPALDQAYDPVGGPLGEAAVTPLQEQAQTFTVGFAGTLAFVELWITQAAGGGQLICDVRPTLGGIPLDADPLALASITIPDGMIGGAPGLYAFDFRPFALAVTPGTVLAVTVRVVGGGGDYRWGLDDPGGYAGGSAFTRPTAGSWAAVSGADFIFRTHVTPPP